jgi:uncharacterized protein
VTLALYRLLPPYRSVESSPALAGAIAFGRAIGTAAVWCAALVLLLMPLARAAEGDVVAVPALKERVTDLTGSLNAEDETRITARIRALEQKKGAQIAVLLVPTTQPEPIFDYAVRVAESWKIGRKGVDDGVVFVVAKDDRKMQILTGPGIQGVLTDAMSKRIITEYVAPRFREGKFGEGVYNGVDRIAALIDGEALPPPPAKKRASKSMDYEGFVFLAIFAALFVGPLLRALLGRFLGAAATGGVTGAAAWFIAGGLVFPIIVGVVLFVIALFAGLPNLNRHGGGWGGGGWSSGGGGGGWSGGGDSFSGGGGGFDGGGASGDW